MHCPTKHKTGQLNKHVVVFSVAFGLCVSSGVAARRAGAQGIASMPAAQCGRVAIKHNSQIYASRTFFPFLIGYTDMRN